jgi:two-component system sensor histidine kinase CpxA
VRNAVRHTPEGTTVKVSLRCRREGEEGHAVLSVRDEGPGVPKESLADIFRPFYRVDDSRTRETGGAGLGLAITERAVRLHGGTVTATNVPGGGFVVEIRLPLTSSSLPYPGGSGEAKLFPAPTATSLRSEDVRRLHRITKLCFD